MKRPKITGKMLMWGGLLIYFLSPVDLFSDLFPGIGWLDDAALAALCVYLYRSFFTADRSRGRQYQYTRSGSTGGEEKAEDAEPRQNRGADPHAVLGVSPGARPEEIRDAYRKLASRYHPDKLEYLGEEFKIMAERRFKEIQEAYEILRPRK